MEAIILLVKLEHCVKQCDVKFNNIPLGTQFDYRTYFHIPHLFSVDQLSCYKVMTLFNL